MRLPKQVLIIPYRIIENKVEYCIFRRKDMYVWQWIAGGVEDFDKDILSAAEREVYGIEIVEQAIEDAKENCKINNITNAKYYAGDTEKLLSDLIEKQNVIPDVVVVDPPRRGLDNTTIENIKKIKAEKVIYISCNPATLVRDLSKVEEQYEIKEIQPLDMFPFSHHVESIAVLVLK